MARKKTVDVKKKSPEIPLEKTYSPKLETPEKTMQYVFNVLGINQREVARITGISPYKLNDMVHGRRPMDDALLQFLGWERTITYRRIDIDVKKADAA